MSKKYVLMLLIITGSIGHSYCQDKKNGVGFYVEMIMRNNSVKTNSQVTDISTIDVKNTFGVGLGSTFYFSQFNSVSWRISPGLCFEKDVVEINHQSGGSERTEIGTIFAKIPVHAIVKVTKTGKLNLVTGLTPYYQITGNTSEIYEYNKFDLTADLGISYSINLGGASIRPELKYSAALIDANVNTDNSLDFSFETYRRNRIALTIFVAFSKFSSASNGESKK